MNPNPQNFLPQPIQQFSEPVLAMSQKFPTDCKDSRAIYDFEVLIPQFIDYARFDLRLSENTVIKYGDCLHFLARDWPHLSSPTEITLSDITVLKRRVFERGGHEPRANSMIFALRKFLTYCKEIHKIDTINPKDLKPMKIPKRQVVFLSKEEVNKLLGSIRSDTKPGLRMKALMSVLLASGMRISEALSLSWDDIDWDHKEAVIIGKGNKQRTVYFNDEALGWLRAYKLKRNDSNPALFVTFASEPKRMKPYDLSKQFKRYVQKAGIKKKVTPHILRHTMATIMSQNGADIRNIQLILGHNDIETTAKYYLGVDQRAVKEAHNKYLDFTVANN